MRALLLLAMGVGVVLDMFYDGHPREEPGAIVCRVAPSFLRFGSYQLPSARGDRALLAALVRYTIDNLFPGLEGSEELKLAHWFERVCVSTARLVVDWMRVGFVHGVLNTDNMSILGLTIDYGPYGFLDDYDPAFTPNTTDSATRRYRYAAQPEIGLYNLTKLAEALSSLFPSTEVLVAGLSAYEGVLRSRMQEAFSDKLGLTGSEEDDADLIATLGRVLAACEVDMTLFFRRLGELELGELGRGGHDRGAPSLAHFEGAFYDPRKIEQHGRALSEWLARYAARSLRQPEAWLAGRRAHMRAHNPAFILRNYLVHEAIGRAEQGDLGGVARLERALAAPYEEPEEFADLRVKRPDWAKSRPGCSMLSCSS